MPPDARRAPDVVIRQAVAADVPHVVDLVRRVLLEFQIEFGVGSKTDAELLGLPGSYEAARGAFWVAEVEGRIVGSAGVAPVDDGTFELRKMYLLPEARGKGVGGRLLDVAIAGVRERQGRTIVLDTIEQMRDAIALYERRGFVRDDRQIRAPRCTRGYLLRLDAPAPGS